jgi:exopolysaccharide biosynthesis protein
LDYWAGRIRKPNLRLWAVRADLTDKTLGFRVNEKEGTDEVVSSVKITSFTERYHCLVGINANPFSPVSGKEGEPRRVIGITVSRGAIVSGPHPPYDALVFYTDGRAEIVAQAELQDLSGIDHGVGGFFIVLKNGTLPDRLLKAEKEPRHPRSAAGLSADGKTLYLLVVDGRQLGSVGATESEIGILLNRLGASDGLNFDGGGSTALALRYPDGKVRAVNAPIHGGIPGRERGVATCFGIFRR